MLYGVEFAVMKVTFWLAPLLSLIACACFAQSAATVLFVSGGVRILGPEGEGRDASRGSTLSVGETVDTLDGRVQLRFNDGASVSLQPGSRFRVDEFRFSAQGGKVHDSDRGFFSLLKGGFRTLTGLLGKERREQYKVETGVATIGIRGTDYAAALSDRGLVLSTFEGLVEVCNQTGCEQVAPGETVLVSGPESAPRREGAASGAVVEALQPTLPEPRLLPNAPLFAPAPVHLPASEPLLSPPPVPATVPGSGPPAYNYSPVTGPYR